MVDIDQEQPPSELSPDVEAGAHVRNQLSIWDTLIEWRITLQKMLIAANQLPQPSKWETVLMERSNVVMSTESDLNSLLNSFLNLQDILVENNSNLFEPKDGDEEEIDDDEEIASDLDDLDIQDDDNSDDGEGNDVNQDVSEDGSGAEESSDDVEEEKSRGAKRKMSTVEIEEALSERCEYLKKSRNQVLDEWYNKTRFSLASTLKQSKSLESFELPPTTQIEHILTNQKRLIKRTQLKRSNYRILGKETDEQEEEYDCEIFDDDDFYHQLLRELIDSKTSNDSNTLSVSRKWLEIQKMRSKMKKKVDTRASKGRKIRFDVHKELINFMAPIVTHNFTEEAKDELFDSLFQSR